MTKHMTEHEGITYLETLLLSGAPVIIWISLELREIKHTDTWLDVLKFKEALSSSTITSEKVPEVHWRSPEHCVLLVGYSSTHFYVNDPHTGKLEHYDKAIMINRWVLLGCQAVTISL
eukprot:TRINITY_DN3408_c0_g1_i1.p1 TRINITY_DN3408_c0_g1~~TRINITY_DN3408_c0_g1_i1.p1  ORF type:complete len:118 (-),score=18.21 TRINITY_DN3408_c0_g1_i1:27-380(-)